jgi:cytochrome c biogenesis factor
MSGKSWFLLSALILLVLIVLAVVAVLYQRKSKKPPDYRTLFIMGIIWLAIGIPIKNYAMSALGIILTVLGLSHRKEWKEASTNWGGLSKEEKRIKIILIAVLGILVVMGLVLYFLSSRH